MQDWEDLEFYTIDEVKQSRRGKIKVIIALVVLGLGFFGGAIGATVVYGWIGLFVWLFLCGLIFAIAAGANNIRYK